MGSAYGLYGGADERRAESVDRTQSARSIIVRWFHHHQLKTFFGFQIRLCVFSELVIFCRCAI